MKIYVVWDPLYEEVCSVHKTTDGASKKCSELNKKDKLGCNRSSTGYYYG